MNGKKKKGQLSIETLLIYGTVLLVATLAISALVYFGVLDLGKLLPDKCQLGSEVVCENYVGSGQTLSIELRNQIGRNIDIVGLTVIGEEDWSGTDFLSASANSTGPILDADGDRLSVNAGSLSEVITVTTTDAVPVGQKYKGRITVNYKVKGSQIAQAKTGTVLVTFS